MNTKRVSLGILILILLGVMYSQGRVQEQSTYSSVQSIKQVIYQVTDSNDTAIITWFNSDFTQSFKYQVMTGSLINVTFLTFGTDDPVLDIAIGNLTRSNITDREVDGNLALGYWRIPEFGLIANTSWSLLNDSFHNLGFIDGVNYSLSLETFSFSQDMSFSAVKLWFNDGFQNTTLLYSRNDGLLLQAHTSFMNYVLGFELFGLNYNVNEQVSTIIEGVTMTTTITENLNRTQTTTIYNSSISMMSDTGSMPFPFFALIFSLVLFSAFMMVIQRRR